MEHSCDNGDRHKVASDACLLESKTVCRRWQMEMRGALAAVLASLC